MELFERFYPDAMTRSPEWVLIWLQVLLGVLSISVLFALFRHEARAILFGTLMGMGMVIVIYSQFGFTRILGVGHILFWTPTLFYMVSLQGTAAVAKTWFGRWLWLAIVVMGASLILDYSDLMRYLLGEREVIVLPEVSLAAD
ncbi:MAG: hypothetical protein HRT82_12075 [Henriciella sp.]|nr:hypothetical protein [Henriciella sp.]